MSRVNPLKQPLQHPSAKPADNPSQGHMNAIDSIQPEILPTEKAQRMAEFFSALADPNRLKLISALAKQELCVRDLAALVEMGESAVSHQLRLLRTLRLVSYRKEGRNVYYRLADHHVINLYREVAEHLDEAG